MKELLCRAPAVRPLILAGCFCLVSFLVLTTGTQARLDRTLPAHMLAQTSPLATSVAGASTLASSSPVSVLLVGAVLLGILLVIALVIRRQR